jgi:hypothetical protein
LNHNYWCFDHRLVICAALLDGLMANNRRQGFRLVQAKALRPVWDGSLCVPHVRMLGAYNRALASSVYVLYDHVILPREGLAPSYICGRLGYIACERGCSFPRGRLPYTCPTKACVCSCSASCRSQVPFVWSAALPDTSLVTFSIPLSGDGVVLLMPHP